MTIKTKKGMASLYLVAFTTLLLGILSMSFVQVMLTESKESVNSDLSQSAYDSALAGIEDAKTAIIMYNTCRENRGNSTFYTLFNGRCESIIKLMGDSFEAFKNGGDGDCDTVPKILGLLSENDSAENGETIINEQLNQSYTCVTVTNEAYDYLTTLGEVTPSRTIPIRLEDDQYRGVQAFEIQWYSRSKDDPLNIPRQFMPDLLTNLYSRDFYPLGNKNQATESLPIIAAEIIQTDDADNIQMYELDLNNETNTGTDHATVVLYPDKNLANTDPANGSVKVTDSTGGLITNFINANIMLKISNKDGSARGLSPQPVYCATVDKDYNYGSEYRCRATIEIPPTYRGGVRGEHTFMLRLSLPYGAPEDTDVSIRACTAIAGNQCTEYAEWVSQFVVDSTGRASTLYRRLTARIDTINTVFIYPDYAIEARGKDAAVEKDFYATKNCWATDDAGGSTTCANNGDAKIYPEEEPNTTN